MASCMHAGVKVVCIPQRGGQRTPRREAYERSPVFKSGQRFRAGIEGRISVLFRGRGMKRVSPKDATASNCGSAPLCLFSYSRCGSPFRLMYERHWWVRIRPVTNLSKSDLPLYPAKVVDIRPKSLSLQRLIALLAAVSLTATLGLLFWGSPNVVCSQISFIRAPIMWPRAQDRAMRINKR